jgi:hypothetical protein
MIRGIQITVSLACLAIIFYGAGYAVARGILHGGDPHAVYLQIDRESFHNKLPDIPVTWAYLDGKQSRTNFVGTYATDIEIDRDLVSTDRELLDTLRSESCRVAVREEVLNTGEQKHGSLWQACMNRFQ